MGSLYCGTSDTFDYFPSYGWYTALHCSLDAQWSFHNAYADRFSVTVLVWQYHFPFVGCQLCHIDDLLLFRTPQLTTGLVSCQHILDAARIWSSDGMLLVNFVATAVSWTDLYSCFWCHCNDFFSIVPVLCRLLLSHNNTEIHLAF